MKRIEESTTRRSREIWSPVPNLELLYEVSNRGRVRNRKHIMSQYTTYDGYKYVIFCVEGKRSKLRVHRLVAQSFIENDDPENKIHVDHIDTKKENNDYRNLKWVSVKENLNNLKTKANLSKCKTGKKHPLAKKIIQYSLDGKRIKSWGSSKEIHDSLGFCRKTIGRACTGRLQTAYKYKWKYGTERASVTS